MPGPNLGGVGPTASGDSYYKDPNTKSGDLYGYGGGGTSIDPTQFQKSDAYGHMDTSEGDAYWDGDTYVRGDPSKWKWQSGTGIHGTSRDELAHAQHTLYAMESGQDSVAAKQYRLGMDEAQQRMNNAAVGRGSNPLAQRAAIYAGGDMQNRANHELAMMRAQEMAAARQQYQDALANRTEAEKFMASDLTNRYGHALGYQASANETERQADKDEQEFIGGLVNSFSLGMASDERLKTLRPTDEALARGNRYGGPSAYGAEADRQHNVKFANHLDGVAKSKERLERARMASGGNPGGQSFGADPRRSQALNQQLGPGAGWGKRIQGLVATGGGDGSGSSGAAVGASGLLSDEKLKAVLSALGSGELSGSAPDTSGQIGDAEDATLQRLAGYRYRYKPEALRMGEPAGEQYGPMAQDLEQTPLGANTVHDTPQGKRVDAERVAMMNTGLLGRVGERIERLERALGTGDLDGYSAPDTSGLVSDKRLKEIQAAGGLNEAGEAMASPGKLGARARALGKAGAWADPELLAEANYARGPATEAEAERQERWGEESYIGNPRFTWSPPEDIAHRARMDRAEQREEAYMDGYPRDDIFGSPDDIAFERENEDIDDHNARVQGNRDVAAALRNRQTLTSQSPYDRMVETVPAQGGGAGSGGGGGGGPDEVPAHARALFGIEDEAPPAPVAPEGRYREYGPAPERYEESNPVVSGLANVLGISPKELRKNVRSGLSDPWGLLVDSSSFGM